MVRPTIVTMAVGRRHARLFRRYAFASWQRYARRIGADLVVFDAPLDRSARAAARSVSWQKCLAVQHPRVRRCRQVAWLDADIVIAPDAPSLFETTPIDRVGAVDAYGTPDPDRARRALDLAYARWRATGVPFVENRTPEQYHTVYGLPHGFPHVVQAGVMVLSPEAHGPRFRHVYDAYEERGGAEWNYEQRALSFELQRAGLVHWLDPRFNLTWLTLRDLDHPQLATRGRLTRRVDWTARRHVRAAMRRAYCLHFAGCAADMAWS
jgi:hypothetical protein